LILALRPKGQERFVASRCRGRDSAAARAGQKRAGRVGYGVLPQYAAVEEKIHTRKAAVSVFVVALISVVPAASRPKK
jgi:hypothetical protein